MNVLHIIETTGPGGAETVFLNLIGNLNVRGTKSHVVIEGKGWVYDEVVKSGIIPTVIRSEWPSFDLKYLLKLILFIKKKRINVIHSHLLGANVYCSIAGIICRIPVISTLHGTVDANPNDRFLILKFKLVNKGSRKIVFVSEYLKKFYFESTCIDKNKSIVIYNGVNVRNFEGRRKGDLREKLGFTANDILIGSIGNIRKPKGYDVLIKSAAILKNNHPECRFIIVGEGDNKLFDELVTLRKVLGVEDTVIFLGFRADVATVLSDLDIFILPSITEGFSISTIEAMAVGVPVIITNSGGPTEIITNNEDGIVIPPNNPEAIAEAIIKLILNPKIKAKITTQAKITVQEKFSIEKMMASYTGLYENITGK